MDYPGKVITKNQVTPTQTSATGVWTLDDQAAAIKNNNWPVALVPNPISKSLRFNSADSAYLNRTPSVAGNLRTWTWSGWVKRSALGGAVVRLFNANDSGSPFLQTSLRFDTDQLRFYNDANSTADVKSSAVYRDASAWYHIVCAIDTTQATSSNRVKLYVNGSQVTALATATYPNQNTDMYVNAARAHQIGSSVTPSQFFDGYLTEINFVDGQALTPSSFGMTNPQTGQWIPLKYSGTYGTNGFYLNFKDATSTTTLGYDYSGNANNWTTNNFSVTAGVNNDSFTDVPTPWIAYNTVDSGGVVRGNYCTLNPLVTRGASTTFSNGNLTYTNTAGSADQYAFEGWSTITSQYYECTATTVAASSQYIYAGDNAGYYCSNGQIYINGSLATTVATYTSGDVLGFAVTVGGVIRFYKNGTLVYTSSGIAAGTPLCNGFSSTVWNFNFGQRSFNSTPPAGYKSLCTTNLPATTIGFGLTNQGNNYFDATLYTGNNSTPRSITGLNFQPDWVWIKDRSSAYNHTLWDAVRGVGSNKGLSSNSTDPEGLGVALGSTAANGYVSALNSNGFEVTSGSSTNVYVNTSPDNYVSWNWKAGGTGVTNTSGTITSTVSANTTSGFSIATLTAQSSGTGTFGHGLGVAPSMVIVKQRASAGTWVVYHTSIGNGSYLILNTAAASVAAASYWNSTSPSSTVVTLGTAWATAGSLVAYCFAPVAGYSAFGSYTGNGSADGPFVYLGFRPRYLLIKISSGGTGVWYIWDSSRDPYNFVCHELYANTSAAEYVNTPECDFVSNGFKMRSTFTDQNGSGNTYIYAAFAESPFQFSNAR
jgi:hypothetical protein